MSYINETQESTASEEVDHRNQLLAGVTGFRRDILFAIVNLEDSKPNGTNVKNHLSEIYDGEVGASRVYQNLEWLVDKDLVDRSPIDGRTFVYHLTPMGRRCIESHFWWIERCLRSSETWSPTSDPEADEV